MHLKRRLRRRHRRPQSSTWIGYLERGAIIVKRLSFFKKKTPGLRSLIGRGCGPGKSAVPATFCCYGNITALLPLHVEFQNDADVKLI